MLSASLVSATATATATGQAGPEKQSFANRSSTIRKLSIDNSRVGSSILPTACGRGPSNGEARPPTGTPSGAAKISGCRRLTETTSADRSNNPLMARGFHRSRWTGTRQKSDNSSDSISSSGENGTSTGVKPCAANLMDRARALLMPSFVEGFSLPVAEASARGTPVLCSDIPTHREIAGTVAEFLNPLDAPAWDQAVRHDAASVSPRRDAQLRRLAGWEAPGWPAHIDAVLGFIEDLATV